MKSLSERLAALSDAQRTALREKLGERGVDCEGQPLEDLLKPRTRLVAFVVAEAGTDGGALRARMRSTVPSALIPDQIIVRGSLPRLPNGKVDRKALAAIPLSEASTSTTQRPATAVQKVIAAIWSSLLGKDAACIDTDFFELGGHSLLATRMASRIERKFGVRVAIQDLFQFTTIRSLSAHIEELGQNDCSTSALPVADRTRRLPLSYEQQRLWFIDQLEGDDGSYSVFAAAYAEGTLSITRFERAIARLVERHESLRTTFHIEGSEPEQRLHDNVPWKLEQFTACGDDLDARRRDAESQATNIAKTRFSLTDGPLFRIAVIHVAENECIVAIAMHHIISDAWSMGVVLRELAALYADVDTLPPLPTQYADYAAWQRTTICDDVIRAKLPFWRDHLGGAPHTLELPTDQPRPAVKNARGKRYVTQFGEGLVDAVDRVSRHHSATPFMTLLAAFQAFLGRHTGKKDIVVGTPLANRSKEELEGLIGFMVKSLPLRARLDKVGSFAELVQQIKSTSLLAFEHADVPFDRIVDALDVPRELSTTPVYQVAFALQNVPLPALALGPARLAPIALDNGASPLDLTLTMTRRDGAYEVCFEYDCDLFRPASIEDLAARFERYLLRLLAAPDSRLDEIDALSTAEHDHLLVALNRTERPWNTERLFIEDFEAQVDQTPNAIAVSDAETSLTYRELDQRANQMAHALCAEGVGHEDIVGLFFERSTEYLVAMLAVWKAGAAYVPLEPKFRDARLAALVERCQCPVLLATHDLKDRAAGLGARKVLDIRKAGHAESTERPTRQVFGESLAYIMFTSGSTGQPKGVLIDHRGMINHLRSKVEVLAMDKGTVVAQIATASFDVVVWQFIAPLLVGGRTAVIQGDAAWDPPALLRALASTGSTDVESVPTHMRLVLEELESQPDAYDLSGLRCLMMNGEPLPPSYCARWFELYPGVQMINAYGATEVSDDSHHHPLPSAPDQTDSAVPLSRTVGNLTCYVLDRDLLPCPRGVTGEVYIGGIGVGRGYLGDPSKTAERFVPDPFAATTGARMYRTGDLARYREDGAFDILGRTDHQVKLRGQRVEIGEIETTLTRQAAIRDAVVTVTPDKRGLIAYVVVEDGATLVTSDLITALSNDLPDYMVPGVYVTLDAFPLLTNGKVDRNSLPAADQLTASVQTEYVAPGTALEKLVASVWCEVLEVDRVGLGDNFFRLGGHSLIAIQCNARLRKELGIEIGVRDLFEAQTLGDFVNRLAALQSTQTKEDRAPAVRLEAVEGRDHYPLAPYQLPEWYLHELDPDSAFYNVGVANLQLQGEIDVDAFVAAWQLIVDRHEPLRTTFRVVDGEPVQVVSPRIELCREDIYIDAKDVHEDDFDAHVQALATEYTGTLFDFENGPLFRVGLAEYSRNRFILLFATHHIIWDETSTMNLSLELSEAYNAIVQGRAPELPLLPVDYKSYSTWIQSRLTSGELDGQRNYWLGKFADAPPPVDLPLDFSRPRLQSFAGAEVNKVIPHDLAQRITDFVARQKTTLSVFFLAILNAQLYRLSGQSDFAVGTPIANRADPRLERLLGLFATALPLRCTIQEGMSFAELLRATHATSVEAYDNHEYPSVLAIQDMDTQSDTSQSQLFNVMYGLQNNKLRLMDEVRFEDAELSFLKHIHEAESQTSKFDLTYIVDHVEDGIIVRLNYNTDLFLDDTAERMLESYLQLIEAAMASVETAVADLPVLTEADRTALATAAEPPLVNIPRGTMTDAFASWADETPSASALVLADGRSINYRELDQRSNRWANHIIAQGVALEELIAVALPPGPERVAVLLGVLKSGAAYLPLNPEHPKERLHAVLSAAGATRIIVDQADLVSTQRFDVMRLGDEQRAATTPPPRGPRADQLAYVITTSGTTGTPKAIEITHENIMHFFAGMQASSTIRPDDRTIEVAPYTFDAYVADLLWPLAHGASVVLPAPGTDTSLAMFAEAVNRHQVTIFECVPLVLAEIVDLREAGAIPEMPSLRLAMVGGAALTDVLCGRFLATFPNVHLANHYGPTEVTVDATKFDCDQPYDADIVPIGRPLGNARLYVLDENLQQVPIGVSGEIYISSPGLARGYRGDPERTARAFVPNPFLGSGRRMYRTGDLGRFSSDGNLHFLGRVDSQVKLRGNRVELEDVEAHMVDHQAVRHCAALVSDDQNHLYGYVELAEGHEVTGDDIRGFLRDALPDYMVPERIHVLERLPRTTNGKVDKHALRAIKPAKAPAQKAPDNEIESLLVEVWQSILGGDAPGVTDDFFDVGGHSLRAASMLQQVCAQFGVKLQLRDFYRERTIRGLANQIILLGGVSSTLRTAQRATKSAPQKSPVQGWGQAHGHHGEAVQGMFDEAGKHTRFLVSLPCPVLQSEALFRPSEERALEVRPAWREKSLAAAHLALRELGRPELGGVLDVRSNIPLGWGLGSSTSDVGASIRAVYDALRVPLSPDTLARIAVEAESASDSTLLSNDALVFAQREGRVIEDFGAPLPDVDVLGVNVDPDGRGISTLDMPVAQYDEDEIAQFRELVSLVRRAVRGQDAKLLAAATTLSARISQRHAPKPRFAAMMKLVDEVGALGIQVAHSGTVVGLLFDPHDPDKVRKMGDARRGLAELGHKKTWHFSTRGRHSEVHDLVREEGDGE